MAMGYLLIESITRHVFSISNHKIEEEKD